jgi:hypothetical protein
MALLINTQIGTDRGITSDGYVRIQRLEYSSKTGVLTINPKLYVSSDAALSASREEYQPNNPSILDDIYGAKNTNVKDEYKYPITSSRTIEVPYVRTEMVSESVMITIPDPNSPENEITSSSWTYTSHVVSGSEEEIIPIIDNSIITQTSIYEFAYPLLKADLEIVFGEGNIQDV